MRRFLYIVLSIIAFTNLQGQSSILDNQHILENVEDCLYATYGCDFSVADSIQQDLEKRIPEHPAPHFLKALIIYWENFPLLPDDPEVKNFEAAMSRTIDFSELLMGQQENLMEAVFFDMHARAFRGMFWADNGKPAKVVKDIDNMYRSTIKGIEFKETFNEFYFSSGLYNYYIEAYVELHPVYEPIALLFRKGDKALGLKELDYAIEHTTFIKYEALLFMSLIQLNYERDITRAADYAAVLYNNFPDNIYYMGQYLIILLHSKNYSIAQAISSRLRNNDDPFQHLIFQMTEGFIYECYKKEPQKAKSFYMQTIESAESFGAIANLYAAIAYAGLARIADAENRPKDVRFFRRKSNKHSSYQFILDFEK